MCIEIYKILVWVVDKRYRYISNFIPVRIKTFKAEFYTTSWENLTGRKFGEFGKYSAICQTKTIQISSYN